MVAPANVQYVQNPQYTEVPAQSAPAAVVHESEIPVVSEEPDMLDDEELKEIVADWDKLLNKMKRDKRTPLRAFLAEKKDLRYKNEILYVIFDEGFTFAVERLNEEDNYKYTVKSMREIFGLNIEPRFILDTQMDDMNFDNKNEGSKEEDEVVKSLQDKLGDSLEIEDEE